MPSMPFMVRITLAELHTELDFSTEDGKPKPKMEIVLVKSPQFDVIIAAQAREAKEKEEPACPPQEVEA